MSHNETCADCGLVFDPNQLKRYFEIQLVQESIIGGLD
jgi:hypothetical protein